MFISYYIVKFNISILNILRIFCCLRSLLQSIFFEPIVSSMYSMSIRHPIHLSYYTKFDKETSSALLNSWYNAPYLKCIAYSLAVASLYYYLLTPFNKNLSFMLILGTAEVNGAIVLISIFPHLSIVVWGEQICIFIASLKEWIIFSYAVCENIPV